LMNGGQTGNTFATGSVGGATSCLKSPAEHRFQAGLVAARQFEAGPVLQNDYVFSPEKRLQFLDAVDVQDGRAMDPDKTVRIEMGFQLLHGLPQQVPGAAAVNLHVVALGL